MMVEPRLMQAPASPTDFPARVPPGPCETVSSPLHGGVTLAAPANSTSASVAAKARGFIREGAGNKLLWLPTPCLLRVVLSWKWFRGGDGGHRRAPSSRGECSADSLEPGGRRRMWESSESEVTGKQREALPWALHWEHRGVWKQRRCCFTLRVGTWLLLKVHLFNKFLHWFLDEKPTEGY